jgi:signal transduction histidine kinase
VSRPADAARAIRGSLRAHPLAADTLLAVTVTAAVLTSMWIDTGPLRNALAALGSELPPTRPVWYVSGLLMGLPLALRRRYPLTVLLVTGAAFSVFRLTEAPEPTFSAIVPFLAVYSAGVYGRPRWRHWARAVAMAGFAGTLGAALFQLSDELPELSGAQLRLTLSVQIIYTVVYNLLFFLAAWLLGDAVRRSRRRAAQLAERAAELEAANAVIAEQAVTDERVRIARELHDVVAHHVSVMGIQAGAARRVLDRDPQRAVAVLASVEASSREAVRELQQLLGFLRRDGDDPGGDSTAGKVPQPTLAELGELVDRMRTAGLAVELRVVGLDEALPPGVELSAYRIVQEALTNALKHAGPGTRTVVLLDRDRDGLRVTVTDDGRGRRDGRVPPRAGRPGRGLIGIRERAGLHGGAVRAGPGPGGGYEVRATIPV